MQVCVKQGKSRGNRSKLNCIDDAVGADMKLIGLRIKEITKGDGIDTLKEIADYLKREEDGNECGSR